MPKLIIELDQLTKANASVRTIIDYMDNGWLYELIYVSAGYEPKGTCALYTMEKWIVTYTDDKARTTAHKFWDESAALKLWRQYAKQRLQPE